MTFISFSTPQKNPRSTVNYNVRIHQETEQNETKSWTGWPKATRKEDNFSRVTSLRERRLAALNITTRLKQCPKNVSKSTVKRRLCEVRLYGRIAIKKPLLRKQSNVKKLQWVKEPNDWTIEQWNKVFWTDESKFKIFVSICSKELVKEL